MAAAAHVGEQTNCLHLLNAAYQRPVSLHVAATKAIKKPSDGALDRCVQAAWVPSTHAKAANQTLLYFCTEFNENLALRNLSVAPQT